MRMVSICRFVSIASLVLLSLVIMGCSISKAQEMVPTVDISQDVTRQIVIASGTPDIYQGHPSLVKNPDDSMLLVWNIGHGGFAGPVAKSIDEGRTWFRLDNHLPDVYHSHKNCPSIFRLVDKEGKARHWVFSSQPYIARIVSEDNGDTWKSEPSLGFANVMAFSSIIPKNPNVRDGCYIGFYHRRRASDGTILNCEPPVSGRLEVVVSETTDAGFSWSEPRVVARMEGKDLCEPCAFWSPNLQEICCLMRENTHKGRSMVTFSSDSGEHWSNPQDTSWELTGDRHIATYVSSERLFIAFRDQALDSETKGHFVGWVGTYDDIKAGQSGDYRVKMLHSYAQPTGDCGYPGVAFFSDGTIFALTYIKYRNDENKHSIVGTRFTVDELDQLANVAKVQK